MMTFNIKNWCILPTAIGDFRMYDTEDETIKLVSYSALEDIGDKPLFRMHSSCIASEIFGAQDCDCADQLNESMRLIASNGEGLIIYLQQEGRGHGLSRKISAVSMMQKGNCDTAESFERLGFEQDIRDFSKAVAILEGLGINAVKLISNNPYKINFLKKHGIEVEPISTHPKVRPENKSYLISKNEKLGHKIPMNGEEEKGDIHFYHSDQKWGEFSNFSKHAIFLDGKIWRTVEHFYQAQKFHNTEFEEVIRQTETPIFAKQKAYNLLKEADLEGWDDRKETIMYRGLEAKFTQHPELLDLLLKTKHKKLVERTDTDDYWGDGSIGSGKNRLGELLMDLRRSALRLRDSHKNRELHIRNHWNIDKTFRILGEGSEGVVFTDETWVYKYFYDITDADWAFLKEKSVFFSECVILSKIECHDVGNARIVRYFYRDFKSLQNFNKAEIINFLRLCKRNGMVFTNIKPSNFIQTESGIKLIDYGRSFISFTQDELLNATKRAFLLWKFPTMENNAFKALTAKINKGEEPDEISGWEDFLNEVEA